MAIYPSTYVSLLKNVPLDADYNHTLYFADRASQTAYFGGLVKLDFNPQTYQRISTNQIKVNAPINTLYGYNYIRIQNGSYENKWFYGFIMGVDYVNDNCTLVTYQIDVMQTFMFDYTLCECFVEREHSETDAIGDSITPEPVATGEMIYNSREDMFNYSDLGIVIAVLDVNGLVDGCVYDGTYSGCKLFAFPFDPSDATTMIDINNFLSNYIQQPDNVISMYMCPRYYLDPIPASHVIPYAQVAHRQGVTLSAISTSDTVDGYEPKNNKLYTYPYNYLMVDNNCGDSMALRYEFFENLLPKFQSRGCISTPVTINCYPINYKRYNSHGGIESDKPLFTEFISLSNFPMCSWSFDAFQVWQSQNTIPNILNIATSALGAVNTSNLSEIQMNRQVATRRAREIASPPIGAAPTVYEGVQTVVPVLGAVASIAQNAYSASIASDICKGNINGGNLITGNSMNKFVASRISVNEQNAKMIDDFFTMYGYAVNRCKVPNIGDREHHATKCRPRWNYIKTVGCQINSTIPNVYANAIRMIYDNGITFWEHASDVGNYSLNNSPSL